MTEHDDTDPGFEQPEEGPDYARIRVFRQVDPNDPWRGLRIDYRSVTISMTWNNDTQEDLFALADTGPDLMANLMTLFNRESQVDAAVENLDAELEDLLKNGEER